MRPIFVSKSHICFSCTAITAPSPNFKLRRLVKHVQLGTKQNSRLSFFETEQMCLVKAIHTAELLTLCLHH